MKINKVSRAKGMVPNQNKYKIKLVIQIQEKNLKWACHNINKIKESNMVVPGIRENYDYKKNFIYFYIQIYI